MNTERLVKSLRRYRKYHRYIGLILAFFVAISAITGILLSLKKEVSLIQPPTQKGSKASFETWKPLHELESIARIEFYQKHPEQKNNQVDRMDVRPGKGIVKVLFEQGYWEVQLDGYSGEVMSIAKRHSDWIEALHDGSIISDTFKLISMNALGIGLLLLLSTGLWLYFGPREVKRKRGE